MNPIIEFNRTISTAVTGLVALGIAFASLAFVAEPYYRAEAIKNQEAHATWAK